MLIWFSIFRASLERGFHRVSIRTVPSPAHSRVPVKIPGISPHKGFHRVWDFTSLHHLWISFSGIPFTRDFPLYFPLDLPGTRRGMRRGLIAQATLPTIRAIWYRPGSSNPSHDTLSQTGGAATMTRALDWEGAVPSTSTDPFTSAPWGPSTWNPATRTWWILPGIWNPIKTVEPKPWHPTEHNSYTTR